MKDIDQPWQAFKSLIATPDLPALGPDPRPGRLPLMELNRKLDRFLAETTVSPALEPTVRAAALLWHDYLDESHGISQNIPGADGSFLHGIMHRREPDYSNAKYWFHRVGKHRSFADIAKRVSELLGSKGEKVLAAKLAPRGDWDPDAFVDACREVAEREASNAEVQRLQTVQEIEFDCLLAHVLAT